MKYRFFLNLAFGLDKNPSHITAVATAWAIWARVGCVFHRFKPFIFDMLDSVYNCDGST